MLTQVGVSVESGSERSERDSSRPTLICFSHLRWDFVFQRPQHLMSRFAAEMPVIYWEEPIVIGAGETAFVKVTQAEGLPSAASPSPICRKASACRRRKRR
jgi:hypothetical protein